MNECRRERRKRRGRERKKGTGKRNHTNKRDCGVNIKEGRKHEEKQQMNECRRERRKRRGRKRKEKKRTGERNDTKTREIVEEI